MKTLHNYAAKVFIAAVALLSIISVMGIWNVFDKDVILKSFQTLGLLGIVAVVVLIAGNFMSPQDPNMPEVIDPSFKLIRNFTLVILIAAAAMLALLGVMAIWDLIKDTAVLSKTFSSLGTIAFSAFVIVMTCLEREKNPTLINRGGKGAASTILTLLVVIYVVMVMVSFF